MMKMKVCSVWVEGPWILIRSPYHRTMTPSFNQDLKDRIEHGARRWDPDQKVWKIDPAHEAVLMEVLNRWFDEVAVLELHTNPAPVPLSSGDDPYAKMLRLCPDPVLVKVYRTIASAIHPDAPGGDAEKMKELNLLWTQIKTEKGL